MRNWIVIAGALVALGLASAGGASASTGGLVIGEASKPRPLPATKVHDSSSPAHLGSRVLRQGMKGDDVRVLHGIIKSQPFGRKLPLTDRFHRGTRAAVKRFQSRNSLKATGVVTRPTVRALAGSMKRAKATWYGPGFYGNQTACGQTLRVRTVGVAHRTLPCGTKVTFRYQGKTLVTRVIDRGPFVDGIDWDLTNGARLKLGFSGSEPVRYAVAR